MTWNLASFAMLISDDYVWCSQKYRTESKMSTPIHKYVMSITNQQTLNNGHLYTQVVLRPPSYFSIESTVM